MWKVQFLDRHHLLIKFGSVDGGVSRSTDQHPAFFAVYNKETTEIAAFYQNSAEDLYYLFEHFYDHIHANSRHSLHANFISSHSNNIHALEQLLMLKSKASSPSQFAKKILTTLPFTCQSQSPPYFDLSLFRYDEKKMEKEREDEETQKIFLPTSESLESIWMVVVSTMVAVAGSFEFGLSVGFSSPSQYGIMHDLDLSLSEYSLFGSILTVGAMVGAIMSGHIADKIGRKLAMAFSDIFCIMGWLAIIFGKDSWWLDLGRLSVGYGIGLLSYVVPIYIAEITPKNVRGAFTTVNQLMICSGASLAWVLGTVISWRALAIIGAAPCIIQFFGLLIIPDSPRWLAKNGQDDEFVFALQMLRGKDYDISEESEEIKEFTKTLESLPQGRMLDLIQKRYLRVVTIGVGLMAFQQFGGINGIGFYATEIFILAGFSSGTLGTVLMAIVQVPLTALGAFLMDRTGRRPLLLVSSSGTCLGCLLIAISFALSATSQMQLKSMLALAGLLVFIGSFSLGMGAIPWVIMSEIFPINMKGSAGSLVTLMNWFGSWVVSYTFNFLMSWSSSGTFVIFTCICGLSVLFVEIMVPETKGKTLEEIQASMGAVSLDKN